jgi:hypothetical protein
LGWGRTGIGNAYDFSAFGVPELRKTGTFGIGFTPNLKLGLLEDIHEQTEQMRKVIDVLQQHGADRFVVLGVSIRKGTP